MNCPKCQKPIEDGAPVWRITKRGHFGGVLFRSSLLCCEACFDEHHGGRPFTRQMFKEQGPCPCRHCRRPIYGWYKNTWHCSEECRRQTQYQRQREKVAARRRPRPCGHCGEEFTPKRNDGRYCSGRCRVAALRAARKASAEVGCKQLRSL